MERLQELLQKKNAFLQDGEVVVYVKNGEMIALYHDGEDLCQVSGKVHGTLQNFLDWLQDDNRYY